MAAPRVRRFDGSRTPCCFSRLEAEAIEWDVLLERARRPGLTLGLARGLEFLAREFGGRGCRQAEVLTELRRRPTSWAERGAYWAACNDPQLGVALLDQLEQHRTHHACTTRPACRRTSSATWRSTTGAMTGKRRDVFERYGVSGFLQRLAKGEPLLR